METKNEVLAAAGPGSVAEREVGAVGAVGRELAEVRGGMSMAMEFPRDEERCRAVILASCGRPRFADGARYAYEIQGKPIVGLSAPFARDAARCWGHIRAGTRVLQDDEGGAHLVGYAWDLQTGTYFTDEVKFARIVERKGKSKGAPSTWVRPNEREWMLEKRKRGAICERNAILKALPSDLKEEALDLVNATCERGAEQDLAAGDPAIHRILAAFGKLDVSPEMLEQRLGHPIAELKASELAELRMVWQTISDGAGQAEDFFEVEAKPAGARGGKPAGVDLQTGELLDPSEDETLASFMDSGH